MNTTANLTALSDNDLALITGGEDEYHMGEVEWMGDGMYMVVGSDSSPSGMEWVNVDSIPMP